MFGYMDGILYSDYLHFIEEVDRKREEMLKYDATLLYDHHRVYKFEKMQALPQGRFTILYQGILFECFFHYKSGGQLYTFLNGALTTEPPQFGRWSYYKFIEGSMLNIADPMYGMYEGLELGWYYGNDKINIRQLIADIVKKIAGIINISLSNVVFVGSSGGGAAVFECASFIECAKTIAINPQMILADWKYAKKFEEITHNDLRQDVLGHRNEISYFLKSSKTNFHILVINIRSAVDMQQLEKLSVKLEIQLQYGLNVFENYIIWLYDADCEPHLHAHNTQEFYCIFFVLEYILKNCDKDIQCLDSFIRLINEFWYYRWKLEKTLKSKQIPDSEVLIQCRECEKIVAVFGTGIFLKRFDKEFLDISNKNLYKIKIAIDNQINKCGGFYNKVLPILHPTQIDNWEEIFIIITSEYYCEDIKKQLEDLGLVYKKNFISWQDLYTTT